MGSTASSTFTHYFPGLAFYEGAGKSVNAYPGLDPKKDQGTFYHDGIALPYYISRGKEGVQNKNAVIVGCAGIDSHYLLSKDEIDDLNNHGLPAIWVGLPLTTETKDFMPRWTRAVEAFLTNPQSPVFKEFPHDVTRYLLDHSTGGQILFKILHNDEANKKIEKIYSAALHMAPAFDSAFGSYEYPEFMQRKFVEHFTKHKDERAGEGILGGLYLRMLASHEHYASAFTAAKELVEPVTGAISEIDDLAGKPIKTGKNIFIGAINNIKGMYNAFTRSANVSGPTYGQGLEVTLSGKALQDSFNVAAANVIQHVFVVDMKDRFACSKTTVRIANEMGAQLILSNTGGHDPMKNRADLRNDLILRVEDCIAAKEKAHSRYQSTPYCPSYIGTEDLPAYIPTLRDCARFAFEGSTRLLNAGTSFAQGLLARGIRNAEMRGQTEGHALDGGDALRLQ